MTARGGTHRSDTFPRLSLGGLAFTLATFFAAERRRARGLRRRALAEGRPLPSPTGNRLVAFETTPTDDPPPDVPVVVFENGMGLLRHEWAWIVQQLRDRYPTVRYDRAGFGASTAATHPASAESMLTDLHTVVDGCRRGRRVVLVGHSLGGLTALVAAHRHPELVDGLVLVDSAHPDQLAESKRQRAGAQQMDAALKQFPWLTWLGMGALLFVPAWRDWLPEPAGRDMLASFRSHAHWKATVGEWSLWQQEINPLARDVQHVPAPVTVVVAGENARRDPAHLRLQQDLRRRSPDGDELVVAGASHEGLVMRAEHAAVVSDAIDRVGRTVAGRPGAARAPRPADTATTTRAQG